MLAFGIKVAWFCLSLSGFSSSIIALPAFARALDGYLIPSLYTITNLVLQGLLCIGMIWKMDPFEMPRTFCTAQPALMGVAWSIMTVITSCMTFATSSAILRPVGGVPASPAYIRSHLRWHPMCLLLAIFPMAAFAAYLILTLKFNAIQPTDGMHCDTTNPVWVRLLSYAGVPLLLALPSLALTCTAAIQYHTRSARHGRSFPYSNDNFTPVPLRRQSKFRFSRVWQEPKNLEEPPVPFNSSLPELSPSTTKRSADQRSITPSSETIVVAEAIPSPPESISSSARARLTLGRAPVSPGVVKPGIRYHLPFQWQTASPRTSIDPLRDSLEFTYSRDTPSPLVFAKPAGNSHTNPRTTTTVSVMAHPSPGLYDAAPWLKDEKVYARQIDRVSTRKHEPYDDDERSDAVSGSLRWVRGSNDSISTVKSELEFARTPQREAYDDAARRPSPVNVSTYDAAHTETPIPNFSRLVWQIILFQFITSATQILATISSLVDMFAQRNPPSAFGTQHIALLLAALAPSISFGFIPWRRKGC